MARHGARVASLFRREGDRRRGGSPKAAVTCHARHHDDGAKKVNGRKRHLLIDTLGLIGKVQVTAADVGDPRRCHGAAGPVGPAAVPSATTWLGRRRRPRPFLDCTRQRRGSPSRSCSVTMADASRAGCRRVPRHRSCLCSRRCRAVSGGADLRLAGSVSAAQQGLQDRPRQPAAVAVAEGRQQRLSSDLACRHHRRRANRRRPRPAEVRQVGQPSDQRITLS